MRVTAPRRRNEDERVAGGGAEGLLLKRNGAEK